MGGKLIRVSTKKPISCSTRSSHHRQILKKISHTHVHSEMQPLVPRVKPFPRQSLRRDREQVLLSQSCTFPSFDHLHTCSDLPARSLLSHPGHQRSQLLHFMERKSSLSLLPILPQGRPVHSRWLALPCGMDFHWHCDCSPRFTLMHSTL